MYLRKLAISDAPLMLEWMHDPEISRFFRANFAAMTLQDAQDFITSSQKLTPDKSINIAVSSDDGEYMGTVSLKHIDFELGTAEFAIVMRSCAMGKGFAWFGMSEIIARGFQDIGLALVWWNVLRVNHRAVRFYEKHNFSEMLNVPEEFAKYYDDREKFKWFSVKRLMTETQNFGHNCNKQQATSNKQQATSVSYCLFTNSYSKYSHIDLSKYLSLFIFRGQGFFYAYF